MNEACCGWREVGRDLGLLFLRVGVGLSMMLGHGLGKLQTFSEKADSWADPIGLGSRNSLMLVIGAEFFCSGLVALGLATRLAAFPLVFAMGVAITTVHAQDPWAKKELAFLFGISFLTLMVAGAGRFSLDGLIAKARGQKKGASRAD